MECIIDEHIIFAINKGLNFWMSILYTKMVGLQGSCPVEYCVTQAVNITLNTLDVQCDLNCSGVLCGQCASNYSLMLGSLRCDICSDYYLLLLFAFAAAGIALVAFLTLLKLTVATETLNSLILYTNIIQVNKNLFFPNGGFSILKVFIAWLN